jgi:hypothetical protein
VTKHVISNTVSATVTLGSAAYAADLLVTRGGVVDPAPLGATAIYADIAGARLVNDGIVQCGYGGSGTAVDMQAVGTVVNRGLIAGGSGLGLDPPTAATASSSRRAGTDGIGNGAENADGCVHGTHVILINIKCQDNFRAG